MHTASFSARRSRQQGVTLIMALLMIVLLSLIVVSAFNLSSSNLKAVANMQSRDEAIAVANRVIEAQLDTAFYNATTSQTIAVDLDKDGTDDYSVVLATPTCIRAAAAVTTELSDESSSMPAETYYHTDWDLQATVTDANTGTSVVIHQGIRRFMNETTRNARCAA